MNKNKNKCNHESDFVIEKGPYLTKAIENAYKSVNPKEAEERLKQAILRLAAQEDMYGKEGRVNGTVFRIYNIINCVCFNSVNNETLYNRLSFRNHDNTCRKSRFVKIV